MPNNKTNVNNLSFQPNDVRDNGQTFVWNTNNDLTQGLTVNFPVELGATSTGYYPAMRLDVGSGERYPGQRVTATGVTAESDELSMKLASDQTTPVTLRFGGAYVVTLGEVGR